MCHNTHIFPLLISGDNRLPVAVRDAIRNPDNEVYLSLVNLGSNYQISACLAATTTVPGNLPLHLEWQQNSFSENQGKLQASTASGESGNIELQTP